MTQPSGSGVNTEPLVLRRCNTTMGRVRDAYIHVVATNDDNTDTVEQTAPYDYTFAFCAVLLNSFAFSSAA
jgi:hypothetical protein